MMACISDGPGEMPTHCWERSDFGAASPLHGSLGLHGGASYNAKARAQPAAVGLLRSWLVGTGSQMLGSP